jgi:hypothetical protein
MTALSMRNTPLLSNARRRRTRMPQMICGSWCGEIEKRDGTMRRVGQYAEVQDPQACLSGFRATDFCAAGLWCHSTAVKYRPADPQGTPERLVVFDFSLNEKPWSHSGILVQIGNYTLKYAFNGLCEKPIRSDLPARLCETLGSRSDPKSDRLQEIGSDLHPAPKSTR